jgi:glycosyltransferase involved in cell wall biosynthesis
MPDTPAISVIMPVYNAAKYLHESMSSILNQTFPDFELIIVNDGSTDDSRSVVMEFKDPRIQFFDNDINQGTAIVSNQGLAAAKGKYIALMDADDVAHPDRFEKQFQFLERNVKVGILGSASVYSNTNSIQYYSLADQQLRMDMFFFYPFRNPTLMLRSDVIRKFALTFDPAFKYTLDYEFVSRLIAYTEAANLNDALLTYRVHTDQVSTVRRPLFLEHEDKVGLRMLAYLGIVLDEKEAEVYLRLRRGLVTPEQFDKVACDVIQKIKRAKPVQQFSNINCELLADRLHPIRNNIVYSSTISLHHLRFLFSHKKYFNVSEILKYTGKALIGGLR